MERTLLEALPYLVGAATIAVLAGFVLFRAVFRYWRSPFAREARRRGRWAFRTGAGAVGALATLGSVGLDADARGTVEHVLLLVLVGAVTWFTVSLLRAAELAALERTDVSVADNRLARSRRTRYLVLRRAGTAVAVVLGLAAALLTFPSVRVLGASLLASAGVLGLVLGVAAQPALKNLVAGIQIAIAEPIRLGDAVVVDGEWGTVEDIALTTVVVRTWDQRRLIHPTSWFTEHAFQNWTRWDAQLVAQVTLDLDFRADVARLRDVALDIIATSEHWDGTARSVQVVDATTEGIQVRILATAVDGPTAWDLRCDVRERVIAWLVEHDPAALPVARVVGTPDAERLPVS